MAAGKGAARAWMRQRILSMLLVPLSIFFVVMVIANIGEGYAGMRAWVGNPIVAVLLVLTFAATFWHAAIGGHEVIEDYVDGEGARAVANLANRLVNLALAVLSIGAVAMIAFGG